MATKLYRFLTDNVVSTVKLVWTDNIVNSQDGMDLLGGFLYRILAAFFIYKCSPLWKRKESYVHFIQLRK